MNKRQIIDEIMVLNRTAKPSFLARFEEIDLNEYLSHLIVARQPRLNGDSARYAKYFTQSRFLEVSPAAEVRPERFEPRQLSADPELQSDQPLMSSFRNSFEPEMQPVSPSLPQDEATQQPAEALQEVAAQIIEITQELPQSEIVEEVVQEVIVQEVVQEEVVQNISANGYQANGDFEDDLHETDDEYEQDHFERQTVSVGTGDDTAEAKRENSDSWLF